MRNEFGTQLEELNRGLISMGALCERAIACAAKAMLGADASLAREAVETERAFAYCSDSSRSRVT